MKKIFSLSRFVLTALFIVSAFFVAAQPAMAATSGPRNAGTGADITGVGTATWANFTNIVTDDTSYASVTGGLSASTTTHYLRGTNYGFTIPAGATINGIQVTIGRMSTGTTAPFIRDNVVKLVKGGLISAGTNKALTTTDWPSTTTITPVTYGGVTDLWGDSWTPAEINASNFGVVLSVSNVNTSRSRTPSVDYMQVTVTYTTDTTAPVIASHANIITTADSLGGATVNYSAPATSDNIDPVGVAACLPASGTKFLIGTTTVTCNATDVAGNNATPTTFTVTVNVGAVDAGKSTVAVSSNSVIASTPVIITITAKDAFGNPISGILKNNILISIDTTAGVTQDPASGNASADTDVLGKTNAQFTSTTSGTKVVSVAINGTAITETQSVVFEIGAPALAVITATPSTTVEANLAGTSVNLDILVTDSSHNPVNDGIAINVSSNLGVISGDSVTLSGHISRVLTYNNKGTATLSVSNSSVGTISSSGDKVINFVDTTLPVITRTGDSTVTVEYRGTYTDLGATAEDNIDGNITGKIETVNPVDANIIATYTVTYDVKDSAGNSATQVTRTVNVVDTTKPVISSITSDATSAGILKVGDSIIFTLTPSLAEPSATVSGSYNGHALVWTTADAGATYSAKYTVVEGDTDQTSPLQISAVTMTDQSGNVSDSFGGTDIAKTIDATMPLVSAVDSDGAVYNIATTSPQTIKITFNEDISNIPTVEVHTLTTGETVNTCGDEDAKTFCFDYAIPASQDRTTHTIYISGAKDMAGNEVVLDNSHTFVVDTLAPAAPVVNIPEYVNIGNQASLPITGTGEANASVNYTISDSDSATSDITGTGTVGSDGSINLTADVSTLAEGAVNISMTLTDAAGNTGLAGTDTATKTVVKPTLVSVDSDGKIFKAGIHTITATFSEAVTGAKIAIAYSATTGTCTNLSATEMTATSDPIVYTYDLTVSDDCDGATATITVSDATNTSGNIIDADSTHTFTVDTLAPVFSATLPATDAFIKNDFSVSYHLSEQLAGGVIGFTGSPAQTYVLQTSDLTAGDHTIVGTDLGMTFVDGDAYAITFAGTDLAGNDSAVVTNTNVKYDTTAPIVLNVTSTKENGSYKAGENILVTVQFSEPVNATYYHRDFGCNYWHDRCWDEINTYPYITLETGDTDRNVNYTAGSGSDTLTFNYVVQTGDSSRDLDYISATALNLNGQTIKDLAGNDANIALANPSETNSLGFNKNIIIDAVLPVIEAHADVTVEATSAEGAIVEYTNPTANDNFDGSVEVTCLPISGSQLPLGDTTITCTAKDALENTATSTFVAHVVDTTAPSITAPADINQKDNGFMSTVDLGTPTVLDVVDASPAVTNDAPSTFPLGDTTVTWTATDAHGNHASATQKVTIYADVISHFHLTASPESLKFGTKSLITIKGEDQYNNRVTNDNSTAVVLSADNGGALENTILTLASGVATTKLSKDSVGTVNVSAISDGLAPQTTQVTFTEADTSSPYVIDAYPKTTGVSINTLPYLIFSEELNPATVTSETVQLKKAGGNAVLATVSLDFMEGSQRVTITPAMALDFNTQYYFVVTNGVQDLVGNSATPSDNEYKFTTVQDNTVLAVMLPIEQINSYAEIGGGYEKGWKWIFNVTVPTSETEVKMKFADFKSALLNIIPAANNIRYSSEQANPGVVEVTSNDYGSALHLTGDLDTTMAGRQIKILVEAKIPAGSSGGSYSTSYGIQSLASSN